MSRVSFMNQRSMGQHGLSVQEVILREKMLKDTILVYGVAMSVVSAVCGILLYWHL
jgi:hypothetical protein